LDNETKRKIIQGSYNMMRAKWRESFENEHKQRLLEQARVTVYGIDPAKHGSEVTAVHEFDWRFLTRAADVQVSPAAPPCPIAEVAFPKQSETDRIWNLIVLAAESSRYG
jgi:hypothetical protein